MSKTAATKAAESSKKGQAGSLSAAQRGRLMRWATYASVTTAVTLIIIKLAAWFLTDSISVLSSLVDSLLDAGASIVTFFAVKQSLVPADEDHRFGHGKAEPLAALGQAGLIAGSALFVAVEALHRFFEPQPIAQGEIGIAVLAFSIVATFALTRFQLYVVRKTGSVAIQADSVHYMGDLLMNAAVILAIVLATYANIPLADPVMGLAIALWLLHSAWKVGSESFDMLMDRELPEDQREQIIAIARQHPEVLGVHDLKTRTSGPQSFIQLHLEVDGGMTLYRVHAISDSVEAELQTAFPEAEVIIHQDPHVLSEETPSYPASS